MKPLNLSVLAGLILTSLLSCSKSSDPNPEPGDPKAAFTNKCWWGDYQDPDQSHAVSRYSLEFTTGNSVVMRSAKGDSTGTYTLVNNTLTLSVPGLSLSATVVDNNKLQNFKMISASSYVFLNGTINTEAAEQNLDNTRWDGEFNGAGTLELEFKPGNLVVFDGYTHPYRRHKGGVVVFDFVQHRFNRFFTIINGPKSLVGNYFNLFGNYNHYFASKL